MNRTILRIPAISASLGYSRSTTYNRIADRTLPKLVRMGPRLVGLPQHELEAVRNARIAGKSDDEIRQLVERLEAAREEALGADGGL